MDELRTRTRHEEAYARRLWYHIIDRLLCSEELDLSFSNKRLFWKLDSHQDRKKRRFRV
eukprot:Pgem_evm1s8806